MINLSRQEGRARKKQERVKQEEVMKTKPNTLIEPLTFTHMIGPVFVLALGLSFSGMKFITEYLSEN